MSRLMTLWTVGEHNCWWLYGLDYTERMRDGYGFEVRKFETADVIADEEQRAYLGVQGGRSIFYCGKRG